MGRGHRGGGPAGRPGRGGRRAGGGGGARGHGGSRPGQPSATIPAGEALLVELRASPGFHEALKGRDCPARSHEASSGATPLGTSQLELADWRDLGALVGWFRDGIAADPLAELAFSPRLTKAARASVHGTATAVGLGGLGTASRGLGEERRVVVMARERAERALPQLDEKQDKKAFWVWRWALQRGLQVSRDEVGEMVLKDALTPELQSIWDKGAAQQRAVQQLCAAAAAGDAAGAEAALAAAPGLLEERVFDVDTGVAPLHVAAREGQAALLELLLARGADPNAQDGHGWTALQVSRKYEQSDAEGVLLRAGAHDPDKDRSILERPARLPRDGPRPAPPAPNGAAVSQPAPSSAAAPANSVAAAAAPSSELDSNASVCGTERDKSAGDMDSNADDYTDLQYQSGTAAFDSVEEEQAGAAEEEGAAAASYDAARHEAAAAGAEQEGGAAAAKGSDQNDGPAVSAESAAAQAEAVELAQHAAAEAEAAAAEAEAEEAEEADEEEEEEEEAGETASAAAETAAEEAISAFAAAVAAAEAAEAAAEEAESLGGTEGAARAAAFRREGEAAVAAAAAAAVAAGEQLDELIETMRSAGSLALASPPVELASNASVCGSELPQGRSLDSFGSDLGAGGPSGSISATSSAAAPVPHTPAPSAADAGNSGAEERRAEAARAAVGDVAQVLAGTGTAAAAAGEAAAGGAPAEGQPAREAAAAAAGDVQSVAAAAAGEGAVVAKEAAAEATSAAAAMRAELEARLPEWSAWAQEHPGTLLAGAGVATAALAGLLLLYRRR